MLEEYKKHVAERAEQGVVPKPLSAEQVAGLVELLNCLLYTSPSPRD